MSFFVSFLTKKFFNETSTNILGVSLLGGTRWNTPQSVQTCWNPSEHVWTCRNTFQSVQTCWNLSKHVSIRSDLLKHVSRLPPLPLPPPPTPSPFSTFFFWGGGEGGGGREGSHHHQNPPEGGGTKSPPLPHRILNNNNKKQNSLTLSSLCCVIYPSYPLEVSLSVHCCCCCSKLHKHLWWRPLNKIHCGILQYLYLYIFIIYPPSINIIIIKISLKKNFFSLWSMPDDDLMVLI